MIAGLVPCSFIDFPGQIAAVVFIRGCNLRCPYCHNAQLIEGTPQGTIRRAELLAWLHQRRSRLAGVVISGGEPTLWQKLEAFIVEIRELGYLIKLDTNGTRPDVLSRLFKRRYLDYVAMDLKDLPERYADWLSPKSVSVAIRESIRLLKGSQVEHEFRTTLEPARHDLATLAAMRDLVSDAPWYLQGQSRLEGRVHGLRKRVRVNDQGATRCAGIRTALAV